MATTNKIIRQFTSMVEEHGGTIDRIDQSGKHVKAYVTAPDGRKSILTMSTTIGGAPRGLANLKADIGRRLGKKKPANDRNRWRDQ